MFIEKEKLWEIDRATEISLAKKRGREIGMKIGREIGIKKGLEIAEKEGSMKGAREAILGLFAARYANCQDPAELDRRLNLATTPEALMAIMQRLFALPLDAPYEEALKLI